jgi:hypothetical protein
VESGAVGNDIDGAESTNEAMVPETIQPNFLIVRFVCYA